MKKILKIKDWKFNEIMDNARRFESKSDRLADVVKRCVDGSIDRSEGIVTLVCFYNIEKETEKAFYIDIDQGTWKTWIPKSAMVID